MTERMLGASKLNAATFEEIEADVTATPQAFGVVVLSSVAAGIGAGGGLAGLLAGTVASLLLWYVWAYLTFWVGTRILAEPQTRATYGEVLRTIGFATAPGVLRVVGVIPALRGLVFLATAVWMLIAAVIAIRQALDYQSTGRAVFVVFIGWLVQVVIFSIVFSILGIRL
ncbi:MAG TPA: hypothetical protein VGL09_09325 [Methylomirabilota bacterium]|jgi:hypothetical protein